MQLKLKKSKYDRLLFAAFIGISANEAIHILNPLWGVPNQATLGNLLIAIFIAAYFGYTAKYGVD